MSPHPWAPGEHTRYLGCPRHAAALDRMDFDDAVDYALACGACVVEFRPSGTTGKPAS